MQFSFDLDDIKYVKILYTDKDGNPNLIKANIKFVEANTIIIAKKIEDLPFIPTPQEITLSVICNDGLYRTKTLLKLTRYDEPNLFLYINIPQGMDYQQNREYFRVEVNLPCEYTYTEDNEIRKITTTTCDISANGVSVILPDNRENDTNTEIVIYVSNRTISAKLRYVRCDKIDYGYKLSYAFTQINEKDRDAISQMCIKKQLEQKRARLN